MPGVGGRVLRGGVGHEPADAPRPRRSGVGVCALPRSSGASSNGKLRHASITSAGRSDGLASRSGCDGGRPAPEALGAGCDRGGGRGSTIAEPAAAAVWRRGYWRGVGPVGTTGCDLIPERICPVGCRRGCC